MKDFDDYTEQDWEDLYYSEQDYHDSELQDLEDSQYYPDEPTYN